MGAVQHTGAFRANNVIEPIVLSEIADEMPLARTEVFGPVVAITSFGELAEAISTINSGAYGLQAGVFTASLQAATAAARLINTGTVVINGTSSTRADGMPFGGVKSSGFGKEGPRYAIREMTVERMVLLLPA
jgi:succinate-semialdehyde dehydrogenase / glutarate-semialdehyde dehydrogenase